MLPQIVSADAIHQRLRISRQNTQISQRPPVMPVSTTSRMKLRSRYFFLVIMKYGSLGIDGMGSRVLLAADLDAGSARVTLQGAILGDLS